MPKTFMLGEEVEMQETSGNTFHMNEAPGVKSIQSDSEALSKCRKLGTQET